MSHGKILVAQGGGPTAVINQSLVGVVLEAQKFAGVDAVYGALHGVDGIVNQNFLELSRESRDNLEAVANTPAAALGSTRTKANPEMCEEIFRVCQAHDIRHFFYIGGNDSSDTLRIVNEASQAAGYALNCVHVPKTIDNDLQVNDHTPGYGSAARFVASAFAGVSMDNRALPGVYVGVVMGRHAGFLTAASALARSEQGDGPNLIYLPERTFEVDSFLQDVKETTDRLGRCMIAVSEGIHDASGQPIIAQLAKEAEYDDHGNVQLSGTGALADRLTDTIKANLGYKRVRGDTFGYLQRSFLGCVSDVDQREAREVAQQAVRFALEEGGDGTVAIHRVAQYEVEYRLHPLEAVAAKTKVMPDEFISPSGNDVTESFLEYARPLIGSGMPRTHRLQAPRVETEG